MTLSGAGVYLEGDGPTGRNRKSHGDGRAEAAHLQEVPRGERRCAARAAIRRIIIENLQAEERLDADARKLLLDHAKMIKDSSADYRNLLGKVKEKLARDRGFVL